MGKLDTPYHLLVPGAADLLALLSAWGYGGKRAGMPY
jgi:hypothetical protein